MFSNMRAHAVVISCVVLSACGGGGGSESAVRVPAVVASGVASKGPLKGASICAFAVTNGVQGAQIGQCTVTSPEGNYSIELTGYSGTVVIQATGGTYIDEATGISMPLATPLRSVVTSLTGSTSMAITPLTELAYQLASAAPGGMTSTNVRSAIEKVQNNFGVMDILTTMPVDALNVPAAANFEQKRYSLALAAVSQYMAARPTGTKLSDVLVEMKNCLYDAATGCRAGTSSVGSILNLAAQSFSARNAGLAGINLGVQDFGTINVSPSVKSVAHRLATAAPSSTCPNGGITVFSGIDSNGNGALDTAEGSTSQLICNGVNGLTTVLASTPEPKGSNCPAGGVKVSAGLDANSNGVLDTAEASSNSFICNGLDGAAGANGSNGLNGANGTNGTNGSNGANGLNTLVLLTTEPSGSNCAAGGSKIQAGLDINSDGVLNAAEVTSAQYICNGTTPTNIDRTPPQITTTAPAVAQGQTVSYTTTMTDDVELAYYVGVSGTLTVASPGLNTLTINNSATVPLGQTFTRTVLAVDTSGNSTKKVLTIASPPTGITLGNYAVVGSFNYPAGFNCLAGNPNPIQDGTAVTSASFGTTFSGNWSAASGYSPQLILSGNGFGSFGSTPFLIPINAESYTYELLAGSGSGGSSPGFGNIRYEYKYLLAVEQTQSSPATLRVTLTMRCNLDNAGFVNGTAATIILQKV